MIGLVDCITKNLMTAIDEDFASLLLLNHGAFQKPSRQIAKTGDEAATAVELSAAAAAVLLPSLRGDGESLSLLQSFAQLAWDQTQQHNQQHRSLSSVSNFPQDDAAWRLEWQTWLLLQDLATYALKSCNRVALTLKFPEFAINIGT